VVDDCGQRENADYLCLMEQVYQTSQNTQTMQIPEDANNVDFDDNLEIHRYVSIYGKQPK
jgi:hypothetical protein